MKRSRNIRLFAAPITASLLIVQVFTQVFAQEATPTFNTLLNEVRTMVELDSETNRLREQEFLQRRDQQRHLLEQAKEKLQILQKQSDDWEKKFDQNEIQLVKLEGIYLQRVGDFAELSGLMGQFVTGLHAQLSNSMVSVHVPEWQQQLDALRGGYGLPDIADIQSLWELFLEYIVLQKQSIRFQSKVLEPDGSSVLRDVVSIGAFTAISDGKFLAYLPEVEQFTQLIRQPDSPYRSAAADYTNATAGFVATPLDPSRGVLLSLLISAPTLEERIMQGGWIGYLIILIGGIGILIGIWRIVVLQQLSRSIRQQMANPEQNDNNPLARLFATYRDNQQTNIQTLELKLDDAVIKELPDLERGLSLLKVFAVITPLMGLLGTVTGMLETFQAITLFGTGDPKLMAGGISQALVTTAMGLMAAIPILLLHTYVVSKSRDIREILQEQGVGLMAAHVEKQS